VAYDVGVKRSVLAWRRAGRDARAAAAMAESARSGPGANVGLADDRWPGPAEQEGRTVGPLSSASPSRVGPSCRRASPGWRSGARPATRDDLGPDVCDVRLCATGGEHRSEWSGSVSVSLVILTGTMARGPPTKYFGTTVM